MTIRSPVFSLFHIVNPHVTDSSTCSRTGVLSSVVKLALLLFICKNKQVLVESYKSLLDAPAYLSG